MCLNLYYFWSIYCIFAKVKVVITLKKNLSDPKLFNANVLSDKL